jgi:glycerol-3-phosphate dehydrogenase (NAD(P)+)
MIPQCTVLFLCVPTWLLRSAIQEIKPFLTPGTILVSVSKGFEKETCTRVDHLIASLLPDKTYPFVFLAGPMIAEELVTGAPTEALAVSHNDSARKTVIDLFAKSSLSIHASDDVEGVITAASLKNIYALGVGICDGLDLGATAHGCFLSHAVREMQNIILAHHGNPETALSIAGIGDLIATTQSQHSTNYTTGIRLARGLEPQRGSEGLNTLSCLARMKNDGELPKTPFLSAIADIVLKKMEPHTRLRALLQEASS